MRKTLPYFAAWILSGVLAVSLASIGVSMVTQQVTSSHPAPLSAEQLRDELAAPEAGDPTTTTTAGDDGAATPAPEGTDGPAGSTPTSGSDGSRPNPPTTTSDQGAGDGGSGGDGPSPTTTQAPPPPTTPTTAPSSVTRTYDLQGGTVTLRFSAAGVSVVSAVPRAGYSVDTGESHDGGARVEFDSDSHRSRVDGWWDAGPRDEVREED